jgi:cytochrome P450
MALGKPHSSGGVSSLSCGPSRARALRYWTQFFGDPLATCCTLWGEYGDAVRLPLPTKNEFLLLTRPEYAEHPLVGHQGRFTSRAPKALLGDGPLTNEDAVWRRHRRLVQPASSHRHVRSFAPAIVEATRNRVAQWTPGSTIDIATEIRTLTMDVIGRVLFGTDLSGDAAPDDRTVMGLQSAMGVAAMLPPPLSTGEASQTLESLIARVVDARIDAPHDEPSDLLDLLVAAGQDEQPLSRAEIQCEAMMLIHAGRETTANALTWALTLLWRYPAARERLIAEVDDVLGGRNPQASDVEALPWTHAVMSETLRLYPPASHVERDAIHDGDISGVPVFAGDTVGMSPYLLHHRPEFWPNPKGFDPQRSLPDSASTRPRYAYLPFGGGRLACLGAGLPQLETTLALAVLAQSARLDLVPTTLLRPRADVIPHPRGPVPAVVTPLRSRRRLTAAAGPETCSFGDTSECV